MELNRAVEALRADPTGSGVFVDYDGTLAPIVLDPDAAVPHPEAMAVVGRLAELYRRVAVVSGRPVGFLARHVPAHVDLAGLYGLEGRRGGEPFEDPTATGWRSVVDAVALEAVEALPRQVELEHKGLSLTLHLRRHPELTSAAWEWADAVATSSGLVTRPAKHSIELHPPVEVDKGTVVDALVEGLAVAAYVGDDAGDLPAFAALDRFAERGGASIRVTVETEEAPAEMLAAADVRVAGPEGAVAFLRALL